MRGIPCWQIDAFTDRPFGGNPAAVCWLKTAVPDDWMQAVAAEMNLSETAFVRRLENDADADFELRWFTPAVEVDLCGHATLAAAHALWTSGITDASAAIRFATRSGGLRCSRDGDFIELNFPALPATAIAPDAGLLESLGIDSPLFVGKTRFDRLIVLQSPEEVRSLEPDFRKLAAIAVRGVIVTAASDDPRFDFISRFFAPAVGVDEDPVCGSAHCSLAPYWATELGKNELLAYQASARGGILRLRPSGDRVVIAGQAMTVWQGELLATP